MASHIDESLVRDARQNLVVLEDTKKQMALFLELVKKTETCGSEEEKMQGWRECCEEVLRFEQYDNETPFKEYQKSAELLYGKSSPEYASTLHLYAEYLYKNYSGNEDMAKLGESKRCCEACIAVARESQQEDELASALELYASVLSAIHDEKNDEVRGGERCDS